jgi:hypothetical protein
VCCSVVCCSYNAGVHAFGDRRKIMMTLAPYA